MARTGVSRSMSPIRSRMVSPWSRGMLRHAEPGCDLPSARRTPARRPRLPLRCAALGVPPRFQRRESQPDRIRPASGRGYALFGGLKPRMRSLPPILVFATWTTRCSTRGLSMRRARALDRIQSQHVPLVFYASRPGAELELIQQGPASRTRSSPKAGPRFSFPVTISPSVWRRPSTSPAMG